MGDGHGGIDKVSSSCTLRGLKSPSMWMYNSTTYRNHTKNLRVYIAFAPSKLLPLPSYAMFYIPRLTVSMGAVQTNTFQGIYYLTT